MATTGVLKNVQVLRAAAAYLVVLYHARLLTPVGEAVSFDFGNAGVDIFFLISGFIIAHVSRSDDVGRPGAFLLKRVIRVVPLYWVLTLMLFAVAQRAPALAGAGGRPDLAMLAKSLFFMKPTGVVWRVAVVTHMMKPLIRKKISTPAEPNRQMPPSKSPWYSLIWYSA